MSRHLLCLTWLGVSLCLTCVSLSVGLFLCLTSLGLSGCLTWLGLSGCLSLCLACVGLSLCLTCGCVCVVVSHLFGFVWVSLCLTCVGLSGCLSFVSHLCGSFVSHLCGFVCQLECLTWREAGAIWCHPPAKTFDSLCLSLLLFSCSCHLLSWSAVCLLAHQNVCRCFFLLPLFSILFGTAALVLLDGVAFWFYFCWFGLCVDTTSSSSSSSSSSSFLSLPPLHFFSFFLLFNSFTALRTWHRRKNTTHLYCSMCTSSYL